MDKQKQIEEAKKVCPHYYDKRCNYETNSVTHCYCECEFFWAFNCLINAGYRKIPENSVPLAIQRFINQLDIDGIVKYGSDLYEKLKETKNFVLKRYYKVEVE